MNDINSDQLDKNYRSSEDEDYVPSDKDGISEDSVGLSDPDTLNSLINNQCKRTLKAQKKLKNKKRLQESNSKSTKSKDELWANFLNSEIATKSSSNGLKPELGSQTAESCFSPSVNVAHNSRKLPKSTDNLSGIGPTSAIIANGKPLSAHKKPSAINNVPNFKRHTINLNNHIKDHNNPETKFIPTDLSTNLNKFISNKISKPNVLTLTQSKWNTYKHTAGGTLSPTKSISNNNDLSHKVKAETFIQSLNAYAKGKDSFVEKQKFLSQSELFQYQANKKLKK